MKQRSRKSIPVSVHLPERSWPLRADAFPGTEVRLVVHSDIEGADLYGGLIAIQPGVTIPIHFHRRGEIQFVLSGRGVLLRPDGSETKVGPRSAVFSPRGRSGAHGFRAIGRRPLEILFFYGSPSGVRPWIGRYESVR